MSESASQGRMGEDNLSEEQSRELAETQQIDTVLDEKGNVKNEGDADEGERQ